MQWSIHATPLREALIRTDHWHRTRLHTKDTRGYNDRSSLEQQCRYSTSVPSSWHADRVCLINPGRSDRGRTSSQKPHSTPCPDPFYCCHLAQSHIFVSLRLFCATSVNEATDAFYRHPVLVQMSVGVQGAVTVPVSTYSVFA